MAGVELQQLHVGLLDEVRVALRLVRDRARVLQDRRVGVDDGGVRVEAQGRREARDAPVRVME